VAAYGLNWKPQSKVPVFIDESIEYSTSYMEDEASKDGRRLLGLLGRHLLGGPPKVGPHHAAAGSVGPSLLPAVCSK
jgi:hypothetical protein